MNLSRLREILLIVLLLVVIAFVVFCVIDLYVFSRRVQQSMSLVDATLTDSRRVLLSIGGTAAEVRKSAKIWAKASQAQADYSIAIERQTSQTLSSVNQTAIALNAIVDTTDRNLNGKLLPQATLTLAQADKSLAELEPVLQNAARVTGDPAVPATLENIERTTEHLNASTASVEDMLRQLDAKVTEVLGPSKRSKVGMAWHIVKALVWGGSNAGQVINLAR